MFLSQSTASSWRRVKLNCTPSVFVCEDWVRLTLFSLYINVLACCNSVTYACCDTLICDPSVIAVAIASGVLPCWLIYRLPIVRAAASTWRCVYGQMAQVKGVSGKLDYDASVKPNCIQLAIVQCFHADWWIGLRQSVRAVASTWGCVYGYRALVTDVSSKWTAMLQSCRAVSS